MRVLTLFAVMLFSACARHTPVVLPGTQYRITELDRRALTLAPPLERVPVDERFFLQFPVKIGASKQDCIEKNDLFSIRIDRKKRQLLLEMPPMVQWQRLLTDWDKVDFKSVDQQVAAISNAPETLEKQGCLAVGSAVELRRILREAIPVRPGQDLYPSYGYRAGGVGFDLRPGVRLKVQRAHFSGEGRTIKDLIGTSTILFECRTDSRGRVAFHPPLVELDGDKLKGIAIDSRLQAPPRPIYRLYLLTSFLKKGVRRSALVLGASTVARMQEMEQKIVVNPAVGCEELDAAACISFEGDVSVSAEILVTVNGKSTWVDWGNSVTSLLRKLGAEHATGLKLRRIFQGKLVPFDASAVADGLRYTALVSGDELTYVP